MGRRQLHWWRHLLGSRGSADSDEGACGCQVPSTPALFVSPSAPTPASDLGPFSPLTPTSLQKFDELLQLASRGQHANVDMLVQDIYGGAHQTLGLSGNLIASSFGKSATSDTGRVH